MAMPTSGHQNFAVTRRVTQERIIIIRDGMTISLKLK